MESRAFVNRKVHRGNSVSVFHNSFKANRSADQSAHRVVGNVGQRLLAVKAPNMLHGVSLDAVDVNAVRFDGVVAFFHLGRVHKIRPEFLSLGAHRLGSVKNQLNVVNGVVVDTSSYNI